MNRFETNLLIQLDKHDELVQMCVTGNMGFPSFIESYNNFFNHFALDGHEANEEQLSVLNKLHDRILIHERIALEILNNLCSEEDSEKIDYIKSGRFGQTEALLRLKAMVSSNV